MKNKTFTIVNLISKYIIENEVIDEEDIITDLLEKGFDIKEIEIALNWLEGIGLDLKSINFSGSKSFRILAAEEDGALTTEAKNYLFTLKAKGYIDYDTFENILERIIFLNPEKKFGLDEIKLLISLISFNSIDTTDENFLKILSEDGEILYN